MCGFKNVTVCTFKTSRAWCRYTRGRFERTHGNVLNPHTEGRGGSSSVLLTKICPRMVITWPQRSTKEINGSYPFFQFENMSRATRCRFLQSFAVPDEAVQFQQSWGTLRRVTWFGLSPPSSPSSTNRYICICVCVRVCVCVCVCTCMCMKVYVSAHVYMFMTFHNGFMFFATSYIYIYIYIYMSSIVKDTTTFELEFCGHKQAQHRHMYGHIACG